MSDFDYIDDPRYWGMRPNDEHWYNRKKVLIFGKRKKSGLRRKLVICFFAMMFKGELYVFDELGHEYDSIPEAARAIRNQYRKQIKSKWDSALSVVFHKTPLGVVSDSPIKPRTEKPRRRRRTS